MSVRICPVELHLCDRPGCDAGFCEMALERPLMACTGCGVLVSHNRVFAFCIECEAAEPVTEKS